MLGPSSVLTMNRCWEAILISDHSMDRPATLLWRNVGPCIAIIAGHELSAPRSDLGFLGLPPLLKRLNMLVGARVGNI